MRRLTVFGVLAVGLAALGVAHGQPVRERASELREVIRSLTPYPEKVRKAVIVIASDPKLAGKLFDAAKDGRGDEVTLALKDQPKDVQEAGQLLAKNPEVLEVMIAHKALLQGVAAAVDKLGPEKVKEMIEEFKKQDAKTLEAVEVWARRLTNNKLAMQQYLAAIDSFHESQPDAPLEDYGYGLTINANKVAGVYALPPGALTLYVLLHSEMFTELSDELVELWLTTDSNDDFSHVMYGLYETARYVYPPAFFEPDGRPERLKEAAQLRKQLGELKKGEPPTLEERIAYFKEHVAEYPNLAKLTPVDPSTVKPTREGESPAKPRVKRKIRTVARAESSNFTAAPPPRPVAASAAKQLPNREVPEEVKAVQPTEEQMIRRAALAQQYQLAQQQMLLQQQQNAAAAGATLPAPYAYPPYYSAYNPQVARLPYAPITSTYLHRPVGGIGRRGGIGR